MELNGDQSAQKAARHPRGIKPRLTERLLLEQEGIISASVWFHDDQLAAHVTVRDDVHWTVREIQALCMNELGLHQTPRTVLLIQARPTSDAPRLAFAA